MNSDVTIDYRNPELIRKMGFEALTKSVGPVGMAYFTRQFDRGQGDYTHERQAILNGMTVEDVECQLGNEQI